MSLHDTTRPTIFFDGVCGLCNRSVQFVIRHDKKEEFLFATLQSDLGQSARHQLTGKAPDSFILFHQGKYYTKSGAALSVCRLLGGVWSLLYAGIIIPSFIRDAVYDFISRNRYKWFGTQACMVPPPGLKARFLS